MARKQHTKDEVLKALFKKNDVLVQDDIVYILKDKIFDVQQNKVIPNPSKQNDLGNGSWGKIDYLCNHLNYIVISIENFGELKTVRNIKN